MRGEYTSDIVTDALTAGSPPLTRGVRDQVIYVLKEERITPACAGSTVGNLYKLPPHQDHPRLRGEYLRLMYVLAQHGGSSPLERGVQYKRQAYDLQSGIIPACAGSTWSDRSTMFSP